MNAIASTIGTVLAIACICGAFTYGCGRANEAYYTAYKQCLEAKGSWVPSGQATYSAFCIRGGQ